MEYLTEQDTALYVIFRVKENLFSVLGQDIQSIQPMPQKLAAVPSAPEYVKGTFRAQGDIISVVDLRLLFHWATMEQEYQEFSDMIDARKEDHIKWVKTLANCRETKSPFLLAKDCHRCALGLWRDNYKTTATTIQHLLSAMDEPHAKLHSLADAALQTGEEGEHVVEQIYNTLMPQILEHLEEIKVAFREREFREMILIVRGTGEPIALTVDEVLGMEVLDSRGMRRAALMSRERDFIRSVQQRPKTEELIMELDIPLLTSNLELGEAIKG